MRFALDVHRGSPTVLALVWGVQRSTHVCCSLRLRKEGSIVQVCEHLMEALSEAGRFEGKNHLLRRLLDMNLVLLLQPDVPSHYKR